MLGKNGIIKKYVKICKIKYSSLQWKSLETNLSLT